ncbi:pyruvate dehydrogenase E3 component [Williamsoniiplasma luminosum]|uniref:Dihydrolipoyl dehydrogenase n=3 Tax=Williamsoniiplasma luminosum TaxID=214888 RepID=A0A2K8NSK3_9MOLU|nr:dihydrolipoyl dehydrogenase [Williamsoniiplasma luminosum]ATZ16734.1 pyruvate dehydrogenase E3 component [Williamsoniiplasma luminosum]
MFKVKFADIGEGLTEGKVAEVLVTLGQEVKAGDPLFFVETDKVNSEIPAPVTGKIANILIKADQDIVVGEVVMEIDDGSSTAASKPEPTPAVKGPEVKEEENASVVGATPVSNKLITRGLPKQTTPSACEATKSALADCAPALQEGNGTLPPRKTNFQAPNPEKHFDVIIVGAGVGGYVAAIKAANLGLKTLIIEKGAYGGVCLNIGCIPTKTLLKSGKVFEQTVHKAASFGIEISKDAKITVNWKAVIERKEDVVKKLSSGVLYLMNKNKIKHIEGVAEAIDNHTIKVNGETFTTDDLIIATGSNPRGLTLPGFEEAEKTGFLINSTHALSLPKLPKKVIIIGGGVIGVEFASMFASYGSEVVLLQGLPTILEMLDADLSKEMSKILSSKSNITIVTNAMIKGIEKNKVVYELDGKEIKLEADYCLQSVGRKPFTEGFENIGLKKAGNGYIEIANDYCQTNLDNVYAIGDVNGRLMLAHVASHEGLIAVNHIARKKGIAHAEDMKMEFERVPSCIYASPEIATIGKTEEQCKKENLDYKAFKFPFQAIGKALADGDTHGFVKLIIENKYQTVIGAHIIGNRATEMISELAVAMESESTISEIAHAIHPHPTMSEAIGEAAEALLTGKTLNL